MGDNKQPVDQHDEKADHITKQRTPYRATTGIGGGLVGAAVGGLLGRRVGGAFGAVVGTVAGTLVGKGTAERVNHTVESIVDAATSIAEAVNHSVNGVADTLKDTVEQVKPSVVGVVDTVKDTVEQVKPSVVGAANSVAEGVNHSVNGVKAIEDALKDTIEQVKPSVVGVVDTVKDTVEQVKPSVVDASKSVAEEVNHTVKGMEVGLKDTIEQVKPSVNSVEDAAKDTIEQVKPSDNHNSKSKVYEERLVPVQPLRTSQEHSLSNDVNEQTSEQSNNFQAIDIKHINYKEIQQRQEEFKRHQQETAQPSKLQRIQLQSETTPKVTAIILGAATITLMGVILAFIPKQNLLATKSSELGIELLGSNQSLSPTLKTITDGWIFIGNINNTSDSGLVGRSLTKGSQSTNSPVVPSVGSIVTVTVRSGVMLRKNRPQKPNFNHNEQKALAILKPREKLKILKVEIFTPSNTIPPATKVWAKVYRCDSACN